ncbi:MAG: DUF547 domain-containing protein [Pseudomonadota bacterium]
MIKTYRWWLMPLALPLLMAFSLERALAPDSELLDPRWEVHEAGAAATVDHAAWTTFLGRYLVPREDGTDLVAYDRVTAEDRAALEAYIEALEAAPVSRLDRDEQLAYWLNLYNARTVLLILENAPVASIRDIKEGFFSIGPWGQELMEVEGQSLSLNDIEHGIVRPIWQDPRVHYGFNCAATGCPDLYSEAFTGATIDTVLDQQARIYVNDPRGVTVEPDGSLTLSKIYLWFREDFGEDYADLIGHLEGFAEPALASTLKARPSVDGYAYDWSLNGTADVSG